MSLALKLALILAFGGTVWFMLRYTLITRGASWVDPIGLTLQLEAAFFALSMGLILAADLWQFDLEGTKIGAWCLIGFWALTGVVNIWRAEVFAREGSGKHGSRRQ